MIAVLSCSLPPSKLIQSGELQAVGCSKPEPRGARFPV